MQSSRNSQRICASLGITGQKARHWRCLRVRGRGTGGADTLDIFLGAKNARFNAGAGTGVAQKGHRRLGIFLMAICRAARN